MNLCSRFDVHHAKMYHTSYHFSLFAALCADFPQTSPGVEQDDEHDIAGPQGKKQKNLQQPRENRLAYGRDGVECSTSRDSGDSSTYFDPMVQCHSLRSQGTPPPRSLPSPETAPRPPRSAVTRCVLYCVWDRVGWRHVVFVFSLVAQLVQQKNKGEPRCQSAVA